MSEYCEPLYMSDVGGRMGIRLADGRLLTERSGSGIDGLVFMERAMACVNFLRGVPTEDLKAVANYGDCGQTIRDTIIACADAIQMPLDPARKPSPMTVEFGRQLLEQFQESKKTPEVPE